MRRLYPMILVLLLLALAGGGLTGCAPGAVAGMTAEVEDPDYKRGKDLLRMGREREAMAAFLRLIDQRGGAATESHLEVAIIYHKHIKDPISAIYHYKRFIEQRKGTEQARLVEQSIQACIREFARTLPAQPLDHQSERTDLIDAMDRLQRENLQLKEQLVAARAALLDSAGTVPGLATLEPSQGFVQNLPGNTPVNLATESAWAAPVGVVPVNPATTVRSVPAPAVPQGGGGTTAAAAPSPAASARRHVVAKGDTLMSISLRHFGTRNRWRDIYALNRDQLPNESALKIGMELKLPQ